jgi:YfiH family protein
MVNTGVFESTLLSGYTGVRHLYSTRKMGDSRSVTGKKAILSMLGFSVDEFVGAQQIHGSSIGVANRDTTGTIGGVDGIAIVSGHGKTVTGVRTADCVPLIILDPIAKVAAAVHAGWRGTEKSIAAEAVKTLVGLGADTKQLVACVGPHIGACCYTVPEERALLFRKRYDDDRAAYKSGGVWHLDLGWINHEQLVEAGLADEHIDVPITCTSCQVDTYFSYRKDSKETFGEMLGVIGFVS